LPDKCDLPFIIVPGFSIQFPAVKIQAGDGFSVILNSKGEVYTFGKGNWNRLGHGDNVSLNAPTRIKAFIGKIIKDIAVGGRHCLAISHEDSESNGRAALYGWGFNYYFQLGQGKGSNKDDASVPIKIQVIEKPYRVKHISCGYFNSTVMIS